MIDEGLTDVLRRRIIASLIDLGVVGGLTLLFARSQSERFAILDRDGEGRAIFSQADADRVEAIAREFNRTQEIGDTLYAFKAIDILFVLVVGSLLTLLAKVLVPANTGWSLGQRIMGLRVINDELGLPTTSQHLRRTMGGVVDFFPYVIPGLAGWLMARSKPFKRRFGDTLADTAVISTRSEVERVSDDASDVAAAAADRAEPTPEVADSPSPPAPVSTPTPPAPAAAVPSSIDLDEPAEVGARAGLSDEPLSDLVNDVEGIAPPAMAEDSPASRLEQAARRADAAGPIAPFESSSVRADASDAPADDASEIDLTEPASPLGAALARAVDPTPLAPTEPAPTGPAQAEPEPAAPTTAVPAEPQPAEPRSVEPVPVEDEPAPRTPAFPTVAARTDRPLPSHRTEAERQQLFKVTNAPIDLTTRADEPAEKKLPPPPRHRAVRSDWERPVAEAAPVWGPDDLAAIDESAPSPAAVTEAVTETTAADVAPDLAVPDVAVPEVAVPDVAVPEIAVAEPAFPEVPVPQMAGPEVADPEVEVAPEPEPEPEHKEPQWSDEWDSWLYWDAAHGAWLRHDTESGRWVPID